MQPITQQIMEMAMQLYLPLSLDACILLLKLSTNFTQKNLTALNLFNPGLGLLFFKSLMGHFQTLTYFISR